MRRVLIFFALMLAGLSCRGWSQTEYPVQLLGSDGNFYGVQDPQFYSYSFASDTANIINANANVSQLCLERSDGTFLGFSPNSAGYPEAVKVAFNGTVTPIAQFPSKTDAPVCPAIANDGNYYGSSTTNGTYGYGYIYQLTSGGAINVFYSFTDKADGVASNQPPVQASDGNLYWFSNNLLQRYSAASGLTAYPTTPYSPFGAGFIEESDGNFYAPVGTGIYDEDVYGVAQIQPTGASNLIYSLNQGEGFNYAFDIYSTGNPSEPLAVFITNGYTNLDNQGCTVGGNYPSMVSLTLSGTAGTPYFTVGRNEYDGGQEGPGQADDYLLSSTVFGGNGVFYATAFDEEEASFDCSITYTSGPVTNISQAISTPPPIAMSFSTLHVLPGGSSTLTWQVNNAFSDTMQQCYGFGGISGKVALSGTKSVTLSSAGTQVSSIICGGTETGLATLTAGDAALSLTSSATRVTPGTAITLTATVTNAATPAPTGKVNFLYGSTVLGSASLTTGTSGTSASFSASTAGIPAGTYPITASYVGDSNYGPANSSSVSITVLAPTASTTSLAASQTVLQGATVSLTATVTGVNAYPTGKVSLLEGTAVLATATLASTGYNKASQANFTESTTAISPGTYTVTASYGGDSANLASKSSAVTVTVEATTPVTLAVSPNPVPAADSFTLTATVKGKDNPSGTVSFLAGTQVIASGNVSGGVAKVTLPSGTLSAGTYSMTAQYAGDANNNAGTSPVVSVTVQ